MRVRNGSQPALDQAMPNVRPGSIATGGASSKPAHVPYALKAEVNSEHQQLRDDLCGLRVPPLVVIQAPNWSLESCAANSAHLNRPPSKRRYRPSRARRSAAIRIWLRAYNSTP